MAANKTACPPQKSTSYGFVGVYGDHVTAGTNEYSCCRPPSTDFERTAVPDTRKTLLSKLAEKGFGRDQMAEMQKIIDAENSEPNF